MKVLCFFAVLAVLGVTWAAPAEDKFSTKYDNIDVRQIITNKRLAGNYITCLKENKKCTADGSYLREVLPQALKSDCGGCSPKQKEWAEIVLPYLSEHYEKDFKELEDQFDPDRIYRTKHAELAAKKGVKI